jgi:hypothetical protein
MPKITEISLFAYYSINVLRRKRNCLHEHLHNIFLEKMLHKKIQQIPLLKKFVCLPKVTISEN